MSDARTDARTHPPSEQRIAEARRAGHVPQTAVLALAWGLAGCLLGLSLVGAALEAALAELLRGPLSALAAGHVPAVSALLAQVTVSVGGPLLLLLLLIAAAVALGQFVAQGPAFGFASSRQRTRFQVAGPARVAPMLAALGSLAVTLGMLPQSLRVNEQAFYPTLQSWSLRLLLVLGACAVVDLALARTRFFRALWMTRREHRDELREAYGSPEMRTLRERVRRASARWEQP